MIPPPKPSSLWKVIVVVSICGLTIIALLITLGAM